MQMNDINRCYFQYKKSIKSGIIYFGIIKSVLLVLFFFILMLTSLLDFKSKKNKKIWIIKYSKEPYDTINKILAEEKIFNFLKIKPGFILPKVFVLDFFHFFKLKPFFVIKNIVFFAALAFKISRYYYNIKKNNIYFLIVMQEYSFYISYLTTIMEKRGGKLYNIMHGVPGKYYSFFRCSKCFVWSDYFKKIYIRQGADKNQFIISGSIFHQFINKFNSKNYKIKYDICYPLEGKVDGFEDVLDVLIKLRKSISICIKQHPRYKVNIKQLKDNKGNTLYNLLHSNIIIAHYSTILLDALVLNKKVISYIANKNYLDYVSYLPDECIVTSIAELEKKLNYLLNNRIKINIDINYLLNLNKNAVKIIREEIEKDLI